MFGKCGERAKMNTDKRIISYNAGKEKKLLSQFVQK